MLEAGRLSWITGKEACLGIDPELFFSTEAADQRDALAQCERCPTRQACFDHAMKYREEGIWGGTTDKQRDQFRRIYRRNK